MSSGVRRTVDAAEALTGLELVVAVLGLEAAGAPLWNDDGGDGRDFDLSCFDSVVDSSSFE